MRLISSTAASAFIFLTATAVNGTAPPLAAALHADYAPVSTANPAEREETRLLYATGLGPVDPPLPAGTLAPVTPLSWVTTPLTIFIGGAAADASFVGLAPGYVGLYQLNVRVPMTTLSGEVDVQIGVAPQLPKSNIARIAVR